ncbi:hypothetical protein MKW92_020335 [Papaver armeniacum]|nr:hypothetical protein MKW92_020335 [Papaver armeniacum]
MFSFPAHCFVILKLTGGKIKTCVSTGNPATKNMCQSCYKTSTGIMTQPAGAALTFPGKEKARSSFVRSPERSDYQRRDLITQDKKGIDYVDQGKNDTATIKIVEKKQGVNRLRVKNNKKKKQKTKKKTSVFEREDCARVS